MKTLPAPAPDPIIAVRDGLRLREDQLLALLGPSIPVERFVTVALHAINSNRDLLTCTPASIVEAIREAAALRLEPTGLLGDAYLVRYGDQARLMPGYRGLMKLARRSGEVEKIDAQVVYDGDAFAIHLGTDPEILHDPVIDGDRGNYTGAYAYARMKTGEVMVEWMSVADIEVVRRSSKASTRGPWVTFWGEMARKTVLRRLMKRLPLSTDAEQGLRLEAEAEAEPLPAPRRTPAAERVRAQLGIHAGPTDEESAPPSSAGVAGAPAGGAPADAPVAGQLPAFETQPPQPDDHSGDPTAAWSAAEQRAMQSGDPLEADDDLPPMP